MRLKQFFLMSAILWTLAILTVCWMPMSKLVEDDGSRSWMFTIPYFDKLVHFGIFMIFAILWFLASDRSRPWRRIFTAGILLAAITEIVQTLPVIGRQADLDDAACDLLGVAAGILFIGWFLAYLGRQQTPALAQTPA